jgi:hypothetical protein
MMLRQRGDILWVSAGLVFVVAVVILCVYYGLPLGWRSGGG